MAQRVYSNLLPQQESLGYEHPGTEDTETKPGDPQLRDPPFYHLGRLSSLQSFAKMGKGPGHLTAFHTASNQPFSELPPLLLSPKVPDTANS